MGALQLADFLLIGGALALMGILYLLLGSGGGNARANKRAARLKNRRTKKVQAAQTNALSLRRQNGRTTSPFLELLMRPLPDAQKLTGKLQRAGSTLDARQFLFRCVLVVLLFFFTFIALQKNPIIGLSLGIMIGLWLPVKFINRKVNKKQRNFLKYFPDGIDLIVRGLRSGLPVSESINLVAQEVPEPVGPVFKHLADTMRLGVPMEKALQETARKLDSTEFNFFTTSIILQRETGGNLSEILNNLSEVIRKRYMMRMKIRAMTSEARASSMIIGVLPFFVFGAILVISPGYMNILWEDYRGNICAAVAGGMLYTGVWVMNRMAKFEI